MTLIVDKLFCNVYQWNILYKGIIIRPDVSNFLLNVRVEIWRLTRVSRSVSFDVYTHDQSVRPMLRGCYRCNSSVDGSATCGKWRNYAVILTTNKSRSDLRLFKYVTTDEHFVTWCTRCCWSYWHRYNVVVAIYRPSIDINKERIPYDFLLALAVTLSLAVCAPWELVTWLAGKMTCRVERLSFLR